MEKIDYKQIVLLCDEYILSPNYFVKKYGETYIFWKDIFMELIKEQKIVPVYKIKTHKQIVNFDNDWAYSRSIFCKLFHTKDGEIIDGSEIRNLEIRFKKN